MSNEKKIRPLDKVQSILLSFFEAIVEYQKVILMVLIPIGVVAGAAFGWKYYQDGQNSQKRKELAAITDQFDAEDAAFEKKKAEVKDEAAKKAMKVDHTATMEKFTTFHSSNAGKAEGWFAGLKAASIMLQQFPGDQQKLVQAKDIVSKVVESSIQSKLYQTQSRFLLAGILESKKDFDGALSQLQFLQEYVADDLKPNVYLAKTRIMVVKNQREDAKKTIDELLSKHPTSPEALQAKQIAFVYGI